MNEFTAELTKKGFAPKTRNSILSAGIVAFKYAIESGLIPTDPSRRMHKFAGTPQRRGIVSQDEAHRLFEVRWDDERCRVGNLLAMTTGLRSGEIVALRVEDIGEDRLFVRHSWSFADGLKAPKNGVVREAILLPAVRAALLLLIRMNPHGSGPASFVFFHADIPDHPMSADGMTRALQKVLVDITLPDTERSNRRRRAEALQAWRKRGVCFHSWRHYFSRLMADHVEMRQLQLATGHKSAAMASHYADHRQAADSEAVRAVTTEVFADVG